MCSEPDEKHPMTPEELQLTTENSKATDVHQAMGNSDRTSVEAGVSAPRIDGSGVPAGEWGGLSPKQAWWAGYRVGKGLPADMPRSEAVAAEPGWWNAGAEWQPIATAPKDRLIDIWIPRAGGGGVRWTGCHYDRICDEWRVNAPGEKVRWVKASAASHWMNPPAPPVGVCVTAGKARA